MIFNLILIIVALIGYRLGVKSDLLTKAGVVTAVVGGFLIYFSFDWKGILLILLFFVSSSYWSRFERKTYTKVKEKRTSYQVLANGGGAFIASFFYIFYPNDFWLLFFIGSLAAANADTWGSEIGVLSKKQPYHIIKLQQVPSGTSGAITFVGTLASFFGAFIIAIAGTFLFYSDSLNSLNTLYIVTISGFLGSLIDTFIGATVEPTYRCTVCKQTVEAKYHCNKLTRKETGISFLSNNWVNFIASISAGFIGGIWFWH